MRTRTASLVAVIVAAVIVSACGADEAADGGAATPEDLEAATAAAVDDLATSEDVDADAIEVVTAEEVTWPDGALGCPRPDGVYTQALVPGYRIVLALDGTEVSYHGAEGGEPTRCDDPQPPVDADG